MRIPTSRHATTLFELTMESRHGIDWAKEAEPSAVSQMALAVVRGFGAEPMREGGEIWRFPRRLVGCGQRVRRSDCRGA